MTSYVADLSWKSGVRAIEKLDRLRSNAGDFKHELLNRLRSTMAVNVLKAEDSRLHYFDFWRLFNMTAVISL